MKLNLSDFWLDVMDFVGFLIWIEIGLIYRIKIDFIILFEFHRLKPLNCKYDDCH